MGGGDLEHGPKVGNKNSASCEQPQNEESGEQRRCRAFPLGFDVRLLYLLNVSVRSWSESLDREPHKLGRSQIGLMKHAEEPQEDDDRDRDSDKPQKNSAHDFTSISNVSETSAG